MKKNLPIIILLLCLSAQVKAQSGASAGQWKTWFINSGKSWRLPPPVTSKPQIPQVLAQQKKLDSAGLVQIQYWNAGSPGYRWQDLMFKLWMSDTTYKGALAYMLLGVATYDATIAAWDTKYTYKRIRPFVADNRIKSFVPKPESPSYPCEYSVAAGVAATLISHFYPYMSDSVNKLARQLMWSRVAAGVAYPEDTRAGFELGKQIAEKEMEYTKDFIPNMDWDGKMPTQPGLWRGKQPMAPLAGHYKTVVLDSSSQYRPGPPPDFSKDMAELKNFKPTFRSMSNAFFYASQNFWEDLLHKKIFEYNLHLDPPRAARLYALAAIGYYDGFAACWDAKYTYWGIRPDQYDTTYHPLILVTPPFPGYPSGHAAISGVMSELYAHFFPAEAEWFRLKARQAAESRFQAGIHFRTDNEVGLEMGRKIAARIIQKLDREAGELQLAGKSGQANAQNSKTIR